VQLRVGESEAAEWNRLAREENAFNCPSGLRKRGRCKGFSRGSRRRLLGHVNSISVAADLPDFQTLTLPDESFCDDVPQFAREAKQYLDAYLKRLRRMVPGAACLWRIEWKERKSGRYEGRLAPHFHLLVWGLQHRKVGEYVYEDAAGQLRQCEDFEAFVETFDLQLPLEFVSLCEQGSNMRYGASLACAIGMAQAGEKSELAERARCMSFQNWSSLAWYHVVESGNLDHLAAGCRVERVRSWGGVMYACSTYFSKCDESAREAYYGRVWGFHNRSKIPWAKIIDMDLSEDMGVRLRRVMRRYLEHKTGRPWQCRFGVTVYCDASQFRRLWEVPSNPDPF